MNKYFAEFIGTFVLVSVILNFPSENPMFALAVGLGLAVAIFMAGRYSGGHFNPAVSIAKYIQGEINSTDVILYPLAQIIGGLVAYLLYSGKSDFLNKLKPDKTQPTDTDIQLEQPEMQLEQPVLETPMAESNTVSAETPLENVQQEMGDSIPENNLVDVTEVSASNDNQDGGMTLLDNMDGSPIYG